MNIPEHFSYVPKRKASGDMICNGSVEFCRMNDFQMRRRNRKPLKKCTNLITYKNGKDFFREQTRKADRQLETDRQERERERERKK